jgi:hypothetical protein
MTEQSRVVSKAGAIQTRIGVNYHTAGGSHEISLNVSFCMRRSVKLTRRGGLIRVMLHDLTHIKRGRHGPCFYWTYAGLRREILKQLRERETQVSLYLLWENTNALLIKQWNQAEQVKEVVGTEQDKSGNLRILEKVLNSLDANPCDYAVSSHKTPSTVSPHKTPAIVSPHKKPATASPDKTPATASPHKTQTSSERLNKHKSDYKQQQPFSSNLSYRDIYTLIATSAHSLQHQFSIAPASCHQVGISTASSKPTPPTQAF